MTPLAALAAAALLSTPVGPSLTVPDREVAVGYGLFGGSHAGGASIDVLYRTPHLAAGGFTGLAGFGQDFTWELGATFGVGHRFEKGPRLELLLDAGLMYFSRDDQDDDDPIAVLGSEEVTGSSAMLPFAQVRLGGAWRLARGTMFTLGVYGRAVKREDVDYDVSRCTLAGLVCLPDQAATARYGGTSAGVYLGYAWLLPVRRGGPAAAAPALPAPAAAGATFESGAE